MTFPVWVEACDGQFAASLVGVPKVRVVGQTRSQALDALKAEIEHRVALGELLSLEIEPIAVTSLAGSTRQTRHRIKSVRMPTGSVMPSGANDRFRH